MYSHAYRILTGCLIGSAILFAGIASAQVPEPETSPAQALVDAVPRKLVSEAVSATLSNAESGALNLYLGEVRILKFSSQVSKVAIGNGKVLSTATIAPTEILMIANDAGESTLYIWLKNGTEIKYAINVGPSNPAQTAEQLSQFLKEDTNIKVSLIGDRVFVEGNNLVPEQENRLGFLIKAFPQVVPIFGGEANLQERTVFISAQVLEIKKSTLERLGMEWGSVDLTDPNSATILPSIEGPKASVGASFGGEKYHIHTITPFQTYLGLASAISTRMNLLQQQGDVYMIAAPHLTARCGGKADFNAGGEFPIAVPDGSGGYRVEFKSYGIKLNIAPICDKHGSIRAKVMAEVSKMDTSVSVMGTPGLLTRRAESELDLIDGKAMLLSGLSSLQAGEDVQKVPFLGSIPFFGALFRNTGATGERMELVILITPSFVTPESEVVQRSLQRRNAIGSDMEQKLTDQGIKPFKDSLRAPEEAVILPFAQKPRATEDIDILPQENDSKPLPLKTHKDAISFSGEVSE